MSTQSLVTQYLERNIRNSDAAKAEFDRTAIKYGLDYAIENLTSPSTVIFYTLGTLSAELLNLLKAIGTGDEHSQAWGATIESVAAEINRRLCANLVVKSSSSLYSTAVSMDRARAMSDFARDILTYLED